MSEKNHPCHPPPHRVATEFTIVDLVHCNAAFSSGDFTGAIAHFSDAIALAQMNLVLYSNRSAAYASLRKYFEALTDAKKTVEMKPNWSKGYSRLRAAQICLGQEGARDRSKNEPLKSGLADAQSAASWSRAHPPASPFGDASSNLEMWSKLTADPTNRPYLQQSDFMRLMLEIQKNPNNLNLYLKDQRVMQALGVLLNLKSKGKAVGNVAYKNKGFDTSIQHYSKAIELDDEDISYIMNRATSYLVMSKTDRAVEISC